MSITVLITGKLVVVPERRTSASGKSFTTARIAAATEADDSVLVSVIAFGTAAEQLAALAKGDTLAIAGRAKPKAWTSKDGELKAGLDVVAEQVLTVYSVRRKRSAVAGEADVPPAGRSTPAARSGQPGGHAPEFDEDAEWLAGGST